MCHASVVKYPCSLSLSLSGPFGIREWRVPYVGTGRVGDRTGDRGALGHMRRSTQLGALEYQCSAYILKLKDDLTTKKTDNCNLATEVRLTATVVARQA